MYAAIAVALSPVFWAASAIWNHSAASFGESTVSWRYTSSAFFDDSVARVVSGDAWS